MSPRDLVYVGHMLDMAKKAVSKTQSLSRDAYDADENLRLALIHLIQIIGEAWRQVVTEDLPKLVAVLETIVPPEPPITNG